MAGSCKRFPTYMHQALARMAIVAVLGGVCPPPVLAATVQEPLAFNIPSGPLSNTLIEIGRRSGIIVSFSPGIVQGQTAAAVQGLLTPMQAFARALGLSGLALDVTESGTVTVVPALGVKPATPTTAGRSGPVLNETAPTHENQPHYTLEPVLINASAEAPQEVGLRALVGSTATRTDTPLSELPQAVSVMTRDALELQRRRRRSTSFALVERQLRQRDGGVGVAVAHDDRD